MFIYNKWANASRKAYIIDIGYDDIIHILKAEDCGVQTITIYQLL